MLLVRSWESKASEYQANDVKSIDFAAKKIGWNRVDVTGGVWIAIISAWMVPSGEHYHSQRKTYEMDYYSACYMHVSRDRESI